METILPTIFLTLIVLGLCVLGMSVRVFLKNESFKGGCASNNPMLRDKFGACDMCGRTDFNDDETTEEPCELPAIG